MVASGNDFVVISLSRYLAISLEKLAQKICDRKYGIGADGLLVLEKSKVADIKMRIFNADGSQAQMCGNGARCTALYLGRKNSAIETKVGVIKSQVNGDTVKIKLTEPKDIKQNIPLEVNNRTLHVHFINTGVPHTVIFVEGLDKIDVYNLGNYIRYHKKFSPAGTNADFVEVLSNNSIKVRTYERGVEDETLACGTGAVASSLIAYRLSQTRKSPIRVLTKSGGILKVYFTEKENRFTDVWLEGKAKIVHKGEYYV